MAPTRRRLGGVFLTGATVLGIALASCQNDYPIAATACDDYCLATLRADCDEDYPDECVSECEAVVYPHHAPECTAAFTAWTECLMSAPDTEFFCVADRSRPRGTLCYESQITLLTCTTTTPTSRCHVLCSRTGDGCALTPLSECLAECTEWFELCEPEAAAYLDCALDPSLSCNDEVQACREVRQRLWDCLGP